MNQIIEVNGKVIKNFLNQIELLYGQLKLLSKETSIDEVINQVVSVLRNDPGFHMFNIKIFVEDDKFKAKDINPISTMCYNYFLLNTNFCSQYLFKKDMMFGHIVGYWPTLSPYLFLQIIWHLKCEDLLVESLVHIPLDLCVEILEITIKHIDELEISRARRFIFLLIYKIYYKCLWLHLGILSEQNVIKCIDQLVKYFKILCDLLVSPKFVTPHDLSIEKKYLRHGILVKNILYYIRKCMHSKIESYSENHNLAKLFTLTYGNFDEHTNYYHRLPANEVKSTIIKFDQQLATLLLKQIKIIDYFEFMAWENVNDNKNATISLQNAIVMECHYFIKFMRQNEFLVTNEDLFNCLEQLVRSRKSEKSILTLQELCQDIAKGRLHCMKELIKRYKEWDVCILDFINERIEMLKPNDFCVILKYLHHMVTHVHTKAEKYQVYTSVLKVLIKLNLHLLQFIISTYLQEHFDDNCLEFLYDENCLDALIRRNSFQFSWNRYLTQHADSHEHRALLIFILLNPKKVLSKFVIYQTNIEFSTSYLSLDMTYVVESFYILNKDQYNVFMYILKDIVLQRRMIWHTRFTAFINKMIYYEVISTDNLMNEIYIPYLNNSYFEKTNVYIILSHIQSILKRRLCTPITNFILLETVLIKTASILRRCNTIFSRNEAYRQVKLIDDIIRDLRLASGLSVPISTRKREEKNLLFPSDHQISQQVEPLDMQKVWPVMNTLEIIQEYEKRCFVVHQRLRTNPRCHPKLRTYVQSFKLDRDAFIRHMILHCFESEYKLHTFNLTFVSWCHFGWANEMIAYENVMRISAEASQIVLMYVEKFHKNTFIMLLCAIVEFCVSVAKNTTCDKHDTIRHILLRTLCSMNYIVSGTPYNNKYNHLLKAIQNVNPSMEITAYFLKIHELISANLNECEFRTILLDQGCICDEKSCGRYRFLVKKEIPAMYDAYLFIRECLKLSNTETHHYSERLLRSLCLEG